jgi:GNAT superfamily N-acetyltransferase
MPPARAPAAICAPDTAERGAPLTWTHVLSSLLVFMAEIDRYRQEDRRQVEALYRRVFGPDAAEANRLRWDWQYRRNPNVAAEGPLIWLAREGATIVGQYATMPVRLSLAGHEVNASWGMDVMVAPERQRQGLGDMLFRTWDRHTGASLGLGLSDASSNLFQKMAWPNVGPVPCLVKPLSRRALRRPTWPVGVNRLVSYLTFPWIRLVARSRPLQGEVQTIRHFDASFTRLWQRVSDRFPFAVRRDAAYLNWKYIQAPHVRYTIAVLLRDNDAAGYAVYRHVQEPRGRATLLVDFLTDPDDTAGFLTLVRWIDREARAADSDKIRVFAMHAGFRKLLRKSGYYPVKSSMEFVAKVNARSVAPEFYKATDGWHVTLGDSDQDR